MNGSSEKIGYRFDNNDSAYIDDVQNTFLHIVFPENTTTTAVVKESMQLFVNNCLVFNSNWLELISQNDYYKVKTMFWQIYLMYSNKIQQTVYVPPPYTPHYCNEVVTNINNEQFSLYCFEDSSRCSIEINVHKNECTNQSNMPTLQICFGTNVVFCTQRDLQNCTLKNIHFIVQFILYKFSQY
jgi:hypothetical protein